MSNQDNSNHSKDEFHLNQLASVGQIAAGIAHEVKNPLTAVKGFLQLLKEKHDEKYVEIAHSELDNALSTLENLLHVSKPDLQDEMYQSFNSCVELEALIPLFQDQIYRVQVIKNLRNTDATIYGKRNQLKKALFNLMKNAFEAIPDKGTITVEHYLEDQYVVITIEDTGIGIPKEKLRMLGTPFYTTKSQGTGMGLTQVFSVIYEHNGKVEVYSIEGRGTKFVLKLPRESIKQSRGVIKLAVNYNAGEDIKTFFLSNRDQFEKRLITEAINVKDKIEEILELGNIDLLSNAHRLVLYIIEGREHEMITFAKQEGMAWAKYSLTLAFKLEWIQAIRRVLWDFLYNFDLLANTENNKEYFYTQEKKINELIDQFLNYFFMSYSEYKDNLILQQRAVVEDLSVPIIPLTTTMCILPLIGHVDQTRVLIIEDKLITQVGTSNFETIILDLSGVAEMSGEALEHLLNILNGMQMMGCKSVVTGLRPEIVKMMIRKGLSFENKATTKGTLQQALVDYLT